MKKFILVDPSFDGTTGDKWQYAVGFARSARANGYQFILLSATDSPLLPQLDGEVIDQRPIFSYAFYEHADIISRHHVTRAAVRARERSLMDRREREYLTAMRDRADAEGDVGRSQLQRSRLRAAAAIAAEQAEAAERELANDPEMPQPFNHDDFGVALTRELLKIDPVAGDVVFFHTMTPAMMESFSEASLLIPDNRTWDVDAYCVFHFGHEASDAKTFLDRFHSYSHFGSLSQRLRTGSPFRRLHLLATNEMLARECEEVFGLPFNLFRGLSNLDDHVRACGGEGSAAAMLESKASSLAVDGFARIVVRAVDMNADIAAALVTAIRRAGEYGYQIELRLLFHAKTLPKLRDILEALEPLEPTLVDVNDNDAYIVELTRANLVLLPYIASHYEKRVSAVLYDCAVVGTSCIVPSRTTLATASDYADIWVYDSVKGLPHIILQALRTLRHTPRESREAKITVARTIYAGDAVSRILASTKAPSLEVERRGPYAALFMPAWGRCGSSHVIEAQTRFLLDRGYFVIQVLLMDKAVDIRQSASHFWQLLRENSVMTRGNVQRIAYATHDEMVSIEKSDEYRTLPAFEQFMARIAAARLHDAPTVAALADARIAIVNHVFNGAAVRKFVRCKTVLETHDVQSYQMRAWPLRDAATDEIEPIDRLLESEFRELHRHDHLVNLASSEHRMLLTANARSSLITPYVSLALEAESALMPKRIDQLVDAWGLSSDYRGIDKFDLLLIGDPHPANRESAEWFIEKVYLPHLQPRGHSLALAGRISDFLYKRFGTLAYVFYMGFVPSVQILRSLCKVSVLPDRRGTGISIKTLETFASHQAFVATSQALRGLRSRLPSSFRTFDQPADFANRVIYLLDSSDNLLESQQQSRSSYEILAGRHLYNSAWDAILHELGVRHPTVDDAVRPTGFTPFATDRTATCDV